MSTGSHHDPASLPLLSVSCLLVGRHIIQQHLEGVVCEARHVSLCHLRTCRSHADHMQITTQSDMPTMAACGLSCHLPKSLLP